jgi:hypothetical protein
MAVGRWWMRCGADLAGVGDFDVAGGAGGSGVEEVSLIEDLSYIASVILMGWSVLHSYLHRIDDLSMFLMSSAYVLLALGCIIRNRLERKDRKNFKGEL